jgi:hypothetical protein
MEPGLHHNTPAISMKVSPGTRTAYCRARPTNSHNFRIGL